MGILKSQVFKLAFPVAHAQASGNRRVDFESFSALVPDRPADDIEGFAYCANDRPA